MEEIHIYDSIVSTVSFCVVVKKLTIIVYMVQTLQEKLSILRSALSLNKRSEIFGHCIHRKKILA